ncbi:hypothetical protein H5410_027086 [Solanum commersonii]|uniref:Uncharacterized protein n=1 Tax=Solanum commersonii TaxID=4109 RepID=A0A9J5YYV4_SOLCO|nr:hypothetical protein H5410_027086 [Solanum commersonii]
MELLFTRPTYDIFKLKGAKANRYGRKEQPITRALKKGFISNELLTRYCKLIGHKYPDHICSKCNGEDNVISDVQLE